MVIKSGKRSTRATQHTKIWGLTLVCQFCAAYSVELMQDYSTHAFLDAFQRHINRTRAPSLVASDAGSQLKCGAKVLRSQAQEDETGESQSNENILHQGIQSIRKNPAFSQIEFVFNPPEAQSHAGKIESSNKVMKRLLRSYCGTIRKQRLPVFSSFFEVSSLLCRITALMNGRPIIYDGDTFISIQDVIYPALSRGNQETILECPESIEEHYEAFCQAFIESVALGRLTRFGGKAVQQSSVLKENDVVLLRYPSKPGYFKYAKVVEQQSGHTILIKCLRRRAKDGGGRPELQRWDVKNSVLIFRPEAQNDPPPTPPVPDEHFQHHDQSVPDHHSTTGEEKTDSSPLNEDNQHSPTHPP